MISSKEVRNLFFDFFEKKSHSIKPSAPIVSKNDPSLLFINAGMNQFKDLFLGIQKPKEKRIANTQKCLRVSGKHNDLEEVGYDTYHHTMFEMLGNWSFGNYFKKEAIEWSWELLTKVYKIDKENLYVTVFEGDSKDGLSKDLEAYNHWKQSIPEQRIINGSKKDNFWEMGEKGPCGPCSEIHIDLRPEAEKTKVPGVDLVNQGHPLVIEIWNLVFMEYNRTSNGSLEKLPNKHVDTGMGFERLCMVLQGKTSSYDTDIFLPLIRETETITGFKYGEDKQVDVAMRVIVDHIRAVSFAIADGQLPSNNGAGYVIRRILRRAVRYYYTFLNINEPFIFRLTNILIGQFKTIFPEFEKQKNLISNVIKEEESSFLRTLGQGLELLDMMINQSNSKIISGEKAFELYDTFGFPIDLTELILKEKGLKIDKKTFENRLNKQKQRSKSAQKTIVSDWNVLIEDEKQEFVGYDYLKLKVRITRYRKMSSAAKLGDFYQLVFNMTPFYAEGGGQVGDKGYLESQNGDVNYIIDTKKENGLTVHYCKNLPKRTEDPFMAVVDARQRQLASCNHSATHLLHQALIVILGKHVEQKGSMVHSKYLRFDFSHFSKLTAQQLQEVEDFVNARIREQISLEEQRNVPYQKAIEQKAITISGEKYEDVVRTIRFGKSFELCGGMHVKNTRDIWHFVITSETAIASGIRRIEAITSEAAKDYFISQSQLYKGVKEVLKTNNPLKSITELQEKLLADKKLIERLLNEKKQSLFKKLQGDIKEINGIKYLSEALEIDPASMKDLAFQLGKEWKNAIVVLATSKEDKAFINCYVSKPLTENRQWSASDIITKISVHIDGKGGGQAFFASSGGKQPEGIPKALKEAEKLLNP